MFTRPSSPKTRAARGQVTRLPARAVVNETVIDAAPVIRATASLQPEISTAERLADLRGAVDAMAHAALSLAASGATLAARWMTAGANRWQRRAERRRQHEADDTPMEVMFENFQVFGTPELPPERQAPSTELVAPRPSARAMTIEDVPDLEPIHTTNLQEPAPIASLATAAAHEPKPVVSWEDHATLRIQLADEPVAEPPRIEFHPITSRGTLDDEIGGWLSEGRTPSKRTAETDHEFERSLERVEMAFANVIEYASPKLMARKTNDAPAAVAAPIPADVTFRRPGPSRQPTEFESRMALDRAH